MGYAVAADVRCSGYWFVRPIGHYIFDLLNNFDVFSDEAFDLLACETESFSALVDHSNDKNDQKSSKQPTATSVVDQPKSVKTRYGHGSMPSSTSSTKGKENLSSNASLSWSSSSLDASSSSSPTPEHNAAPAHNRKKKQIGTVTHGMTYKNVNFVLRGILGVYLLLSFLAPPSSGSPMVGGRSKVSPTHVRPKKRSTNAATNLGAIGSKPAPPSLLAVPPKMPFPWLGRGGGVGPTAGVSRVSPKPTTDSNSGRTTTIMQQLRDERLRRLQEFRSRKMNGKSIPRSKIKDFFILFSFSAGEEWPGFDLSPVVENLWDDDHDPWRSSLKQSSPIDLNQVDFSWFGLS